MTYSNSCHFSNKVPHVQCIERYISASVCYNTKADLNKSYELYLYKSESRNGTFLYPLNTNIVLHY